MTGRPGGERILETSLCLCMYGGGIRAVCNYRCITQECCYIFPVCDNSFRVVCPAEESGVITVVASCSCGCQGPSD